MSPFRYHAPRELHEAVALVASSDGAARFIAGGTNLVDLMKERLAPSGRAGGHQSAAADRGRRWQPTAACAWAHWRATPIPPDHPLVREQLPAAARGHPGRRLAADPQPASNGGNLLQRTRCYYFYDAGVPCNKREPGSGCPAAAGLARQHAILGASEHCIATHPSDMCVALAALDCRVHVRSARGERAIAFADFHRLPGDRPELDNTLAADELITHLDAARRRRIWQHTAPT